MFVRAAGLFRHCGVKQESPGSPRRRLARYDKFYSRTGPIMFVVLDTSRWDCVPCFTPALGREDAVAAFNAATAERGRQLRWFERAERVDRRGRLCAFAGGRAWACSRWRRGFFEAPRLRELLVIDSLASQCLDACPHLEGAGHEGLPASSYGW